MTLWPFGKHCGIAMLFSTVTGKKTICLVAPLCFIPKVPSDTSHFCTCEFIIFHQYMHPTGESYLTEHDCCVLSSLYSMKGSKCPTIVTVSN